MQRINCPLCGKNGSEPIFYKASLDKNITNVICQNCGLVYINPRPSQAESVEFHREDFLGGKNVTEVEQVVSKLKTSDLSIKRTIVAFLNEFLRPGMKVVDIGCGFGTLLDILKKEKQVDVFGVEVGNLDVRVAKDYYGLDVFRGSLDEFAASPENDKRFDVVVLNHVLEHLPEPRESFAQIKKILRPNGLLYIGVPNILNIKKRPEEFFQIFHPLNFSPHSLKRMLETMGFGIVKFNVNAGLPGGMEVAARIGAKSIDAAELKDGAWYKDVITYVKATAHKYDRMRNLRDKFLFFIPKKLKIKIGRVFYLFLKHKPFK